MRKITDSLIRLQLNMCLYLTVGSEQQSPVQFTYLFHYYFQNQSHVNQHNQAQGNQVVYFNILDMTHKRHNIKYYCYTMQAQLFCHK